MQVIKHDKNYTITDITEDEMQRLINLTSGHYYPEVRHIKEALENPVETDCLYRAKERLCVSHYFLCGEGRLNVIKEVIK